MQDEIGVWRIELETCRREMQVVVVEFKEENEFGMRAAEGGKRG